MLQLYQLNADQDKNEAKFINYMVTYFNKKDLVSFGNYLLSEKRKARFQASYDEAIARGLNPITAEESMSNVWHSDVCNWLEEQQHLKKILS